MNLGPLISVWDDPFEHGEVFVLDDGGEVFRFGLLSLF
ncbi:unnamed protein product, partial [Prunus brigantina]